MAHKRPGQFKRPPQWWKHLRDWKRYFWKGERQALKRYLREEKKDLTTRD